LFAFSSQAETQPLIIFHQAQSTNDEIEAERLTRSPWFMFILVPITVHTHMYRCTVIKLSQSFPSPDFLD